MIKISKSNKLTFIISVTFISLILISLATYFLFIKSFYKSCEYTFSSSINDEKKSLQIISPNNLEIMFKNSPIIALNQWNNINITTGQDLYYKISSKTPALGIIELTGNLSMIFQSFSASGTLNHIENVYAGDNTIKFNIVPGNNFIVFSKIEIYTNTFEEEISSTVFENKFMLNLRHYLKTTHDKPFTIDFAPNKPSSEASFILAPTEKSSIFCLKPPLTGNYFIDVYSNTEVDINGYDSEKNKLTTSAKTASGNKTSLSCKLQEGSKSNFEVLYPNGNSGAITLVITKPAGSDVPLAGLVEETDIKNQIQAIDALRRTNLKEFILCDRGNSYTNGIITEEMINSLSYKSTGTKSPTDLIKIKKDYMEFLESSQFSSLQEHAKLSASAAINLIKAEKNVKIWFTLPYIRIQSLSEKYIEPYKTLISNIKSYLDKEDPSYWHNNVIGFYWNSEDIPGWYTDFDPSNIYKNPHINSMRVLSDTLHSTYNKKLMWIPYVGDKNIIMDNTKRIGYIANGTNIFDYVILQPTYFYIPQQLENIKHVQELVEKNIISYPGGEPVIPKTSNTILGPEMEVDYSFSSSKDDFTKAYESKLMSVIIKNRFKVYGDAYALYIGKKPMVFYKGYETIDKNFLLNIKSLITNIMETN